MRKVLITLLALASGVLALRLGPTSLSLTQLLSGDLEAHTVVWQLRLPRVLLAALVGGGLALAGACIQGIFRNPLADPSLLGVAGGAAFAAALGIAFAPAVAASPWLLAGVAFVGGLLATLIVLSFGGRNTDLYTILLAGLAVNAAALALVGLIGVLSMETTFRSISFWTMGSLNQATWIDVGVASLILPCALLLIRRASTLDGLVLPDAEAQSLGITVSQSRRQVIVLVAAITGIAVSLTGVIAFVGLIVPHMIRLSMGATHRTLLPCAFAGGAILIVLADLLSRTLIVPMEIPVGIITALLGAPIFVLLLRAQVKA